MPVDLHWTYVFTDTQFQSGLNADFTISVANEEKVNDLFRVCDRVYLCFAFVAGYCHNSYGDVENPAPRRWTNW